MFGSFIGQLAAKAGDFGLPLFAGAAGKIPINSLSKV